MSSREWRPGTFPILSKALAWLALAACPGLLVPVILTAQRTTPGADLGVVGDASADPRSVASQSVEVQTIFRLTNEDRVAQHLGTLSWSPELAAAAQAHATRMAAAALANDNQELLHRYPGEADVAARASQSGAHFSSVAENIATGPDARQIQQQWMRSVPHETNILDPRMSALGVAVVTADETLYAVEDFAETVAPLSPDQVEKQVEAELIAMGLPVTEGATGESARRKADARQQCPLSSEINEGAGAQLVVRWEGPSLALPTPLVEAVHKKRYASASVGACQPIGSQSHVFTAYRIAVLFY